MDKELKRSVEAAPVAKNLRDIAEAFSFAVSSGFMHREHATSVWKACLRVAGMEIPEKEKDVKVKVKGVKD